MLFILIQHNKATFHPSQSSANGVWFVARECCTIERLPLQRSMEANVRVCELRS
jgi:hypothetical protein